MRQPGQQESFMRSPCPYSLFPIPYSPPFCGNSVPNWNMLVIPGQKRVLTTDFVDPSPDTLVAFEGTTLPNSGGNVSYRGRKRPYALRFYEYTAILRPCRLQG